MKTDDNLKLIYVLKIGVNSKNEGMYEFIFSKKINDINKFVYDEWYWSDNPAIDFKTLPNKEYIDKVLTLKTNLFELICLHEADDRPYVHGVHLIHAIAYENEEFEPVDDDGYSEKYDDLFDGIDEGEQEDTYLDEEEPLLVFHYGMSLLDVKDRLYSKNIVLSKDNTFEVSPSSIA